MMSSGGKADLINRDAVAALADFHLALERVGLAFFIESHHDDCRAIAADKFALFA